MHSHCLILIAQVLITIAFNSRASAQLHLFIDLVCNVGTYVGTKVGTYTGTNGDSYIGTNVGIYSVAAKYGIIMKLPTYLPTSSGNGTFWKASASRKLCLKCLKVEHLKSGNCLKWVKNRIQGRGCVPVARRVASNTRGIQSLAI